MNRVEEVMIRRRKALQQELNQLKRKLEHAPEGNLQITRSRGRTLFYESYKDEAGAWQRRYLGEKLEARRKELALKRYCIERIREIQCELDAMQEFQRMRIPARKCIATEMLYELPVISQYLQQELKPMSYRAKQWAATGEPSAYREDEKVHVSQGGLKVRSKAEAMIASCLEERGIPFRYEDQIQIGRHRAIPDFTLMNPETGEKIYWEHFGMMDDERYLEGAAEKMSMYQEAGIYLGVNLIITVESQFQPLTYQTIRGIVEGVMPFCGI